jgi:hypothetical protein
LLNRFVEKTVGFPASHPSLPFVDDLTVVRPSPSKRSKTKTAAGQPPTVTWYWASLICHLT